MIVRQQMRALAIQLRRQHQAGEDVGFSVNLQTGELPRGVMVAEHGAEDIVPKLPSPRRLSAFTEAHAQRLALPDAYFGAWGERKPFQTTLDVSQRFDSVPEALDFGARHAQRTVYDTEASTGQHLLEVPYGHPSERQVLHGLLNERATGTTAARLKMDELLNDPARRASIQQLFKGR